MITAERADAAFEDLVDLDISVHEHQSHLWRIWELRHAISAYDATYVALAEALQAELVTCDGRLARAGGHHANVSVIE